MNKTWLLQCVRPCWTRDAVPTVNATKPTIFTSYKPVFVIRNQVFRAAALCGCSNCFPTFQRKARPPLQGYAFANWPTTLKIEAVRLTVCLYSQQDRGMVVQVPPDPWDSIIHSFRKRRELQSILFASHSDLQIVFGLSPRITQITIVLTKSGL